MKTEKQLDLVFHALSGESRRLILDVIKANPGCCVNDVCEHFEMSRIGVMKHLRILVDANLVISRKEGRTRELFFNAAPIQLIYDRWTGEYAAFWASQAVDLKYRLEGQTRSSGSSQSKKSKSKSRTKSSKTRKRKTKVA